ncbi:NADH:flavin oxidoreductase/NADH oxidase [Craterilacuibacter sp. RT1T]|uniref:NADH:flavin oxidoreductase/NADH oxidase n=1 Tax=Craterilacuibacter sp. RT1T TaxID=2942211 RepID=UPI0020C030C3|nr:NADH:flavin oxidoreductase/NADH oxidase [Craterilacuibacter sp. RT1T]MCL6263536.1 NADH:flavin oxidoreductase/NADH oxidase [Craterilacuibacter sp. RT1T]
MSTLFTPMLLDALTLANRIIVAPMCQYSAEAGEANDWHLMHLGQLAMSGAGLLLSEAVAVTPEGRISPHDLGLYSDKTEQALGRVIRAIRLYSAMPLGLQLAHAGRKASTARPWDGGHHLPPEHGGWTILAPSPVPYQDSDPCPQALDSAGLQRLLQAFADAAARAARLGVDMLELHAAHGYLLHQFLSPLANFRTDAYGGSLENRMRFPLQVFEAVRATFPPGKPVGVRISATDWVEGGWDVAQSTVFSQELKRLGCAYIHASSAGLSPRQQIPVTPGYQVGFAAQIRAACHLPTIAVGLITEAEQAETIVASGQADMVALARAMLYDPRWPWHAAAALGAHVDAPPQYWRSQPHAYKTLFNEPPVPQG